MDNSIQVSYIRGVLLLSLIIGANFLTETIPCKTHMFFKKNMIAKYTLLFFLIFFTINFTNPMGINPIEHIYHTFILVLGYILITRLDLHYMILSFFIIGVFYIIQTYIDYHTFMNNESIIIILSTIKKYILYLLLFVLFIGLFHTFIKTPHSLLHIFTLPICE